MIEDQPPPQVNDRPAIQDLVMADVAERKRVGIERYGTALQAHNGRDALVDLYQELLDAVQYVRQLIEERRSGTKCQVDVCTRPGEPRSFNVDMDLFSTVLNMTLCPRHAEDFRRATLTELQASRRLARLYADGLVVEGP